MSGRAGEQRERLFQPLELFSALFDGRYNRETHQGDAIVAHRLRVGRFGLAQRLSGGNHRYFLTSHARLTTIPDLLEQGVPLEDVPGLAGHANPHTTRLYDRRQKKITRDIVERFSI